MGIIAVPNPNHEGGSAVTRSFRTGGEKHADSFSVARVRPRTSKGITDLLLLTVTRLDAACPSKKSCDGRENGANRRGAPAPDEPSHRPPPQTTRNETRRRNASPRTRRPAATTGGQRTPETDTLVPTNPEPKFFNKTRHLFSRLESRSLSELTRQIAPPTKNGHAPPPTESRKSSQSVNPSSVRAW